MSKNFYNTISFSGKALEDANAKALKQEELVLEIYKANPGLGIPPSQIHKAFAKKYNLYPPIQSIRRSITNLSNPKKHSDEKGNTPLIKTSDMVEGPYIYPEHLWRLNLIRDDFKPKPIDKSFFGQGELFN